MALGVHHPRPMNVGRVVRLDRAAGVGSVTVVEEDRIYRIELGPREVKALHASIGPGAPVRVELVKDRTALRFVVHRQPRR